MITKSHHAQSASVSSRTLRSLNLISQSLGNIAATVIKDGAVQALQQLDPLWDEQKQGLQDKMFGTHVFEA